MWGVLGSVGVLESMRIMSSFFIYLKHTQTMIMTDSSKGGYT